MKPTIESIIELFTEKGSQSYGAEAVNQLEHALQCASLAEISGQNHELITACLLHDLGHLIHNLGDNPATLVVYQPKNALVRTGERGKGKGFKPFPPYPLPFTPPSSLGELLGIDDQHEHRAIPILRQMFESAVTQPIRLHVTAKRYLCSVVPEYWDNLSTASKRSLELQGGIFSPEQAETFIHQPYAQDAVQLRIYDDKAKITNLPTPDLNHFIQFMTASLISPIK